VTGGPPGAAPMDRAQVAIVGGGLAGAALGARLARTGQSVIILERVPAWHWRAAGVFASPAAMAALRRLGLAEATLARVARPIPAMQVETPRGVAFRLTYGADERRDGPPERAVGFDRSGLDPAVLELARSAGAEVRLGWTVSELDLERGHLGVRTPDGSERWIQAELIVGADGSRSLVARAARVARPSRLGPRLGLTCHLPDSGAPRRDARMHLFRDGYVGIAPVPGPAGGDAASTDARVNIGIVLGPSWQAEVARRGGRVVAGEIIRAIPVVPGDPGRWRHEPPTDALVGAWPLGHRVTRRSGRNWLLVGDAAGFLDPFTGEGIHRALVSAELGAAAITARTAGRSNALAAYERAMQRRFLAKDVVSWIVQAFLARPAAFEYAARRLAARDDARATLGLVMGDLVGASRALDPRYLAALLAP
jgi:menaquinone-9 beta-reductase